MRTFVNNRPVNCTPEQKDAIEVLQAAKGYMGVSGYKQDAKKFENQPEYNIRVNAGISIAKLYADKNAALKAIKFDQVNLDNWIPSKGKNAFSTKKEQFKHCIDLLIANTDKERDNSLAAISKNAHKLAHELVYITIGKTDGGVNSIKVHLDTVKNEEGHMRPVLDADGIPTVKSIIIPYRGAGIKKHIVKGIRKKVNSGSKKLMDNAIEKLLPANTKFGSVSLKAGNFTKVSVVKQEIYEADLCKQEEEQNKKSATLKTLKA